MDSVIGGIVKIQIADISSISHFAVVSGRVNISLFADSSWIDLPLFSFKSEASESPTLGESGEICSNSLKLPLHNLSNSLYLSLRHSLLFGFVAKILFADGSIRIYGSPDMPFRGTLFHPSSITPTDTSRTMLQAVSSSPVYLIV